MITSGACKEARVDRILVSLVSQPEENWNDPVVWAKLCICTHVYVMRCESVCGSKSYLPPLKVQKKDTHIYISLWLGLAFQLT